MTDTSHNDESAWLKAKRKMASVLTASEKLAEKGEVAAARRKAHNDGLRGSQGYLPEKKKIIHWTLTTAEMDTLKRIANIPASVCDLYIHQNCAQTAAPHTAKIVHRSGNMG